MKNFNAQKAYAAADKIALLAQANAPLERVFQSSDDPDVREAVDKAQGCVDEALTALATELYFATGADTRD